MVCSGVAKKQTSFRLDEDFLKVMRVCAKDKRWDLTTVVEVAVEDLLKREGYLDDEGNPTDKVKE